MIAILSMVRLHCDYCAKALTASMRSIAESTAASVDHQSGVDQLRDRARRHGWTIQPYTDIYAEDRCAKCTKALAVNP